MGHNMSVPLPPPPAVHSPMHGPTPMPIGQVHTHLGIPGLATPNTAPPPVVPQPATPDALPGPGLHNP